MVLAFLGVSLLLLDVVGREGGLLFDKFFFVFGGERYCVLVRELVLSSCLVLVGNFSGLFRVVFLVIGVEIEVKVM